MCFLYVQSILNNLAMYKDISRLVSVTFPVSFTSNVEVCDKYPLISVTICFKITQIEEKASTQKTGDNNLAFRDNQSFKKHQCWQNSTCSQVMSLVVLDLSPVSPAQIVLLLESSGHLHCVVWSSFLENWPPR